MCCLARSIFKNHCVGQREHLLGPLLACQPHTYELCMDPGGDERVMWWLVSLLDTQQNQCFCVLGTVPSSWKGSLFLMLHSVPLPQQPSLCPGAFQPFISFTLMFSQTDTTEMLPMPRLLASETETWSLPPSEWRITSKGEREQCQYILSSLNPSFIPS